LSYERKKIDSTVIEEWNCFNTVTNPTAKTVSSMVLFLPGLLLPKKAFII